MRKLIDYIRLRRAGFSIGVSWRTARNFSKLDKFLIIAWLIYLLYALLTFSYSVNYALIHNNEIMLARTRLSFDVLQADNSKLEKGVIALLNGHPVKVVDAYYVFNKKLDESIK